MCERLGIYGTTISAYDPADDAVIAAAIAGTGERMRGQLVVVGTTIAMVLVLRFCWPNSNAVTTSCGAR